MTAHDGGVAAHARAVLTTLDRARVELGALDRAVYGAVASTPSPTIDARGGTDLQRGQLLPAVDGHGRRCWARPGRRGAGRP